MTTITQFKIRRPDDFHVHLREGEMLKNVLPFTARDFARALVMPNLTRAVRNMHDARVYKEAILRLIENRVAFNFEPLMTIKLTQDTTAKHIEDAAKIIVAVKLYPEGVTTNSKDGVTDVQKLEDVFKAMADNNLVLCVHAESPGVFCMDRERHYLDTVRRIAERHPKLRIVIEHATTQNTITFVEQASSNIAATLTVHHLLMTLDDVVGDKLNPHNFCKPIAKTPADRDALVAAAISGHPRFFLGTDSAPHTQEAKECAAGCAGCFTAPIALPLLAELFDSQGALHKLERFTSWNGAVFYGLQPNIGAITFERKEQIVPDAYGGPRSQGGVIPFVSGRKLAWRIAE